jgi:hypothetical protein
MSVAKKLIPLLDRVLVEKVAARTKTVGGIILPETASSKARAAWRAAFGVARLVRSAHCAVAAPRLPAQRGGCGGGSCAAGQP